MGRMDDAAKCKVVELRKAGLSFRKIKAVLELEDIMVSVQTIYLFLREFQGRPPGRVGPMAPRLATSGVNIQNRPLGFQAGAQNHMRETNMPTTNEQSGPARTEQQIDGGDKKDGDIQIVSVTSLASNARRRVTASPANNSMLVAGRKLLDRALSQRMKTVQQMTSLLRRDQVGVQRNLAAPQPDKSCPEPGGSGSPRKVTFPRPVVSARGPDIPPRIGIRLPSQPGKLVFQQQSPGGQAQNERNPSPQQAGQDPRARDGLPDQIRNLGVEVRSLGLAVKVLREQQGRMEKEQAEQTNIQKQILKTLQLLACRLEPRGTNPQHTKRNSPPTAAFSQDSFVFNQSSYPSCGQPGYGSLDALESVETFRMSPPSINGFLPCSSGGDGLPGSYPQPSAQPLLPPYTQAFSTFTQSPVGAHLQAELNHRTLPECASTQTQATSQPLTHQGSTIKVEGP